MSWQGLNIVALFIGMFAVPYLIGAFFEFVTWLSGNPFVDIVDAKLFENGYALMQLKNDGYVADRVKSIVLVIDGERYVGRIINATSDVIPPKGESWLLVKFDNAVLPLGRSAMLEITFERARSDWTIAKVLPASLIPEKSDP